MEDHSLNIDTERIKNWRSIVTLIVFLVTNIVVLFPFHIPLFIPRQIWDAVSRGLVALRVIPSTHDGKRSHDDLLNTHGHVGVGHGSGGSDEPGNGKSKSFVRFNFPMNFITAPLIADLFLLAILAIGRDEVYAGTIGKDHIHPYDIMIFFITLAYIAISIDASGLIRYMAFKVLQWGGKVGHTLFFYLYAFFFALGSFIGNDPIVLSGTAFLAYMTRVSSNIVHPRAWIFTQFAVANIASAILVSSNPTNLVLAGAFNIRFIDYTANMIVPVIFTIVILFPFLLYIVFEDEALIPHEIKMHELPEELRAKAPVNPNIPHARGNAGEEEIGPDNEEKEKLLSLEEIMNPFLDKRGAFFGALIMAATLIAVLALNAANTSGKEQPVFWVTAPAAFVMLCWDLAWGWLHRHETRQIARKGLREIEDARAHRALGLMEGESDRRPLEQGMEMVQVAANSANDSAAAARPDSDGNGTNTTDDITVPTEPTEVHGSRTTLSPNDQASSSPIPQQQPVSMPSPMIGPTSADQSENGDAAISSRVSSENDDAATSSRMSSQHEKQELARSDSEPGQPPQKKTFAAAVLSEELREQEPPGLDIEKRVSHQEPSTDRERKTLVSFVASTYVWCQETFPTAMAVFAHLPFALVPFAFTMFVLVQALVSSGWVPVFAYGWDHWVTKTGTVGAIGGMGFLSVVLCNFSGTNIGTTILLCRVIQAWLDIHHTNGTAIGERTFWATVYSMALGVNYGAFSMAFSASLAGLLWRDILARKHIHIRQLEFAQVNLPIIAIAMTVGCVILIGEVYIIRSESPYVRPE